MECKACQRDTSTVLYEDNVACIVLPKESTAIGHLQILPKQHVMMFDELPDTTAQHLLFLANYAASVIFEHLGAHGTNIIVHDGPYSNSKYPHLSVDVLLRTQDDGISFQWQPKAVSPEDMEDVAQKVRDKVEITADAEMKDQGKEKKETEDKDKKQEIKEQKTDKTSSVIDNEDSYYLKQLRRMP